MSTGGRAAVRQSSDLAIGEEIEAWHNGKIYYRGRVVTIIPFLNLISIIDGDSKARRMLDVEALEVVRLIPGPSHARSTGTPLRTTQTPLFLEPAHTDF